MAVFIPGHFSAKSTWIDEMMTGSLVKLVWTQFPELLNSFVFSQQKSSAIASILGVEINCNQSQQSTSSVYVFQNRSEYWTFPVEAVALWVNRKPNKEFDLQMTGSQEVLFWYEGTIISLQFFINLIRRKYFRIQASMNRGIIVCAHHCLLILNTKLWPLLQSHCVFLLNCQNHQNDWQI